MIKISKKGNYILKAIIFLATNKGQVFKIATLSEKLNISESLLRRLLSETEKKLIINSVKGRNGGVVFYRELNTVSVYNILDSIGEDLNITDCTGGIYCSNEPNCNTTKIFLGLQKGFNSILKLYTLDKIIK